MPASLRAALCAAIATLALLAVAPSPSPLPSRIDLTKVQPKALLPKVPLHTEFVVAVNKLGQVTHVLTRKLSKDGTFNLQTYGNALQAFIRTPDGHAVSGRYRLTYDYNPKTAHIHRDVALVSAGGVDPNAEGAVTKMIDDMAKHTPAPSSEPSVHLPPLPQILKTEPP